MPLCMILVAVSCGSVGIKTMMSSVVEPLSTEIRALICIGEDSSVSANWKYARIPFILAVTFGHANILLLVKNNTLLSPSKRVTGDKIPLNVTTSEPSIVPSVVAISTLLNSIGRVMLVVG